MLAYLWGEVSPPWRRLLASWKVGLRSFGWLLETAVVCLQREILPMVMLLLKLVLTSVSVCYSWSPSQRATSAGVLCHVWQRRGRQQVQPPADSWTCVLCELWRAVCVHGSRSWSVCCSAGFAIQACNFLRDIGRCLWWGKPDCLDTANRLGHCSAHGMGDFSVWKAKVLLSGGDRGGGEGAVLLGAVPWNGWDFVWELVPRSVTFFI